MRLCLVCGVIFLRHTLLMLEPDSVKPHVSRLFSKRPKALQLMPTRIPYHVPHTNGGAIRLRQQYGSCLTQSHRRRSRISEGSSHPPADMNEYGGCYAGNKRSEKPHEGSVKPVTRGLAEYWLAGLRNRRMRRNSREGNPGINFGGGFVGWGPLKLWLV